jgi:SAM-dependent methyltransferase
MNDPMTLVTEYKRQLAWRRWDTILAKLPPLSGRTVLDLGCAVGDQAAGLVAAGARVLGLDANEELLREARAKLLPNADFRCCDLTALPEGLVGAADGLWCSFLAAYFPDLGSALAEWRKALRPGGFIALTEIDDLFGHEPLGTHTRSVLDAHARDALRAGRYDFHMGSKLRGYLERAGFTIVTEMVVADDELSFEGPAPAGVLEAWRSRFDRMGHLRKNAGAEFDVVRDEFLACLSRGEHRSRAKVICCVAVR